ncbi:MAG: thioesterase family protein [Salinivirgaceae bacterium]
MNILPYGNFPHKTYDKLRYADTDRQGHVNNAVFSTFFETGRAEMVYNADDPIMDDNCSFVIASMQVDYLLEIKWPGILNIGTCITKIGNSSIRLYQQLYQEDKCVAKAETIIVQVDNATAKSKTLSETVKSKLQSWLIK